MHYYSLLNINAKRDGWVRCGIKLEDDPYDEGIDWEYNEFEVLKIVMQVLRAQKITTSDPNICIRRGEGHSCTLVKL